MDISSDAEYPAGELSNFCARDFVWDGERAASMEGLLQSLKFADPAKAAAVRTLTGRKAKWRGTKRNHAWKQAGHLWWKGVPLDRFGPEYQALLDGVFRAMFAQCDNARRALLDTGDAVLTHERGHGDPAETVLTEAELCSRLLAIRDELRSSEAGAIPWTPGPLTGIGDPDAAT